MANIEKVFLVEGGMDASKHRQEVTGTFPRIINISIDCRFARIHEREKIEKTKLIEINQWNLTLYIRLQLNNEDFLLNIINSDNCII